MAKTIKTGILYRQAEFVRSELNEEARTVPLTFSSEQPVDRYFGVEILDHAPESVDLSRLNNGGAILVDHNTRDQVGVVVPNSAAIRADKKGAAVARFGKGARAQEIFQDVKDGIRSLVSVGYRVDKMVTEKVEKGVETLRATRWTPMEISIVSVPADTSVGIGRADTNQNFETRIEPMADTAVPVAAPVAPPPAPTPGLELGRDNSNAEYQRQTEIDAIADRLEGKVPNIREMAANARKTRMSIENFRSQALEALPSVAPIQAAKPLDVKPKEWSRYSISRAICAQLEGKLDGFEREMSDEMALHTRSKPGGFFVPQEAWAIQGSQAYVAGTRSLVAGTGTLGGMLVQTTNLGDQFIEVLRNRTKVLSLGARVLTLDTPVTIPRQNAAGAANWVGETVASTLNTGNFTQITLTPNAISATQQYSKQLLATNNPSIDMLVRDDITAILAIAIDLAALHGTGSGQPTGIIGTTGIGSILLATNGQVMGNTTAYPALVSLESVVATANADVANMAYLMRPGVRGALKTSARFASSDTPVWDWRIPGTPVNGYRAEVSAQVASNLTTGTATTLTSPIFFGNWSELLVAQFAGGATDIVVDPYTAGANGVIRIYARKWIDIGVRHAASFCVLGGSLTT